MISPARIHHEVFAAMLQFACSSPAWTGGENNNGIPGLEGVKELFQNQLKGRQTSFKQRSSRNSEILYSKA